MNLELVEFKEYLEDLLDEHGFSPEATVMSENETCYILLNPGNYDSYIALHPETIYYHIQMGNSGLYKEFSYENENDIYLKIDEIIETIKRADKRPE